MVQTDGPVVVAGGGIAGLALAAGLQRHDQEFIVIEERPQLAEVGAGISLWPNALAVLDSLGLGERVRAAGSAVISGGIQRPDGHWIQRVDRHVLQDALGEPLVAIHRADLITILASAVDPSSIRTGLRVVGFEAHDDEVAVHLGTASTVRARALVGADGVHSVVAAQLHPNLRTRFAGYTAWRGVAPFALEDLPGETWGTGREFGYVPLGENRTYWFATENAGAGVSAQQGELTHLRHAFADWHSPIPEILSSMSEDEVLRHDMYDRSFAQRWSVGRVTLMGDAAHPMRPHLGQGGCQALEDSLALAGALARTADVSDALREYESLRRHRVRKIVRESATIGRIVQARPPLGPCLHRLVGLTPTRMFARHIAGIAGRSAIEL